MLNIKSKVEKKMKNPKNCFKIAKKSLFCPLFGKKSFLNRTLGLRKSFLNQTTYVLKNRLYPQSFLNRDSFLNQAFLNRDSTVVDRLRWHACVFKPAYWAAMNFGPRPTQITWLYLMTMNPTFLTETYRGIFNAVHTELGKKDNSQIKTYLNQYGSLTYWSFEALRI